ncbi:MAG TPA: 1-acyl-sn-glycerol-3-phosphate acyltransferase, partial [Rhodobacteraceae bacterium]|nr:1-acyl-sn-glycerol-3-phosphate acyltransferase [Paracoccaceae bacterium]
MSGTWFPEDVAEPVRIGPFGWVLVLLRVVPMLIVILTGLAVLLLLRLIEAPLFRPDRPITPYITQGVCRLALLIMGLPLHVTGDRMRQKGAVVANHASWLDIFTLNAAKRIYFVAKAEVAGWPLIGWLARA